MRGSSDPRGQMRGSFAPCGGQMGEGSSDPRGSNEGGHLTPGVDPYREVSRPGPVEGAGSLPVPPGAHTRGPRGAGLAAWESLQGDFVLQALGHGGPPWDLRPSVVGQAYPP